MSKRTIGSAEQSRYDMSGRKSDILNSPELAGRFLAWKCLTDTSLKMLASDRLPILAKRFEIAANNRALADDLLSGVIKRRLSIDHLIETLANCKVKTIEKRLLEVIRLGVYQLVFERGIPEFAAIDTASELAKIFAGRKQVGFVNAVLRTIHRAIAERESRIDDDEKFVLPIDDETGIRFAREILPAKRNVAKYLSLAYSYPRWLIQRWLSRWDYQTFVRILSAGNARAGMVLRPNRIKLSDKPSYRLADILQTQGCRVKVLEEYQMVQLISGPAITSLDAFKGGLFQVQDPTAAMLVNNFELNSGMKILDLCAGLGTKTTQLAEMTNDEAEIFASDKSQDKLERLKRNAKRLDLHSIRTIALDELKTRDFQKYFDIVIVDVPCSNSGVFDRRSEARWRIRQEDFDLFSKASLDLLRFAEALITPDGQIGFSTCSIDKQENEETIEKFTDEHNLTIATQNFTLPVYDKQTGRTILTGGYWCAVINSK